MRQRLPAIGETVLEVGRGDELPMQGHRWQRVAMPINPLAEAIGHHKAISKLLLQGISGRQWKLPAMAGTLPATTGPDATQLGLGDGIKGTDHLDQSGWRQIKTTTGRA